MHNAWTVVAFALVASTLVKGSATMRDYLVNYAVSDSSPICAITL